MLNGDRTNTPLSFVASVSAELLVISLFILIPLAYTDHLPDFHWKSVVVGPPVRPIDPPPVRAQPTTNAIRPVALRTVRIYNPVPPTRPIETNATDPVIDVPPGSLVATGPTGSNNPIADVVARMPLPRPPSKPPENNPPTPTTTPIRVSQGPQMAKLIKRVVPVYPPLARATHTSGVVHLVGVIAKDGTIRNLQIISGHPVLARAALEAVSQWVFRPTLLNGEPVEVICPIDVNFTLSQ